MQFYFLAGEGVESVENSFSIGYAYLDSPNKVIAPTKNWTVLD